MVSCLASVELLLHLGGAESGPWGCPTDWQFCVWILAGQLAALGLPKDTLTQES